MRRSELVRMFVLNKIADDYENLHQITKQVEPLGSACGLSIETSEILQALGELIAADFARAYRLSIMSRTAEEIQGMPPAHEIGSPDVPMVVDAFFWATEKGRQLARSKATDWPFDDDRVLRSNWNPPES
jgi:hypothetical protein